MKLLRRALLTVAAQVFQNGFDSDLRAVEAALVRGHNFVLFLDRGKQSLSRLCENTDGLALRPRDFAVLFSLSLGGQDGLLHLQRLVVQPTQRRPKLVEVSELHRFLPYMMLGNSPPTHHQTALVATFFGGKLLVIGGRQKLVGLRRVLQRDLDHPSCVGVFVHVFRRSIQRFIDLGHGA
jgi:hypothetical protein